VIESGSSERLKYDWKKWRGIWKRSKEKGGDEECNYYKRISKRKCERLEENGRIVGRVWLGEWEKSKDVRYWKG
jgi:hypothetical protein